MVLVINAQISRRSFSMGGWTQSRKKESISAIGPLASPIMPLLSVRLEADPGECGFRVVAPVMMVAFLLSTIALIPFSRTGWTFLGSEGEWNLAVLSNPLGLLFWNRDNKERQENGKEGIGRGTRTTTGGGKGKLWPLLAT